MPTKDPRKTQAEARQREAPEAPQREAPEACQREAPARNRGASRVPRDASERGGV